MSGVAQTDRRSRRTVSREHAELEQLGDVVKVRDLGSTNGTFVNGARIKEHRANEGDTVTFGSVPFRLGRMPTPSSPMQPAFDDLRTTHHNVSVILKKSPVDPIAPRPAGESPFSRTTTGSAMLSLVRSLAEERTANKLAALLEVAAELGKHPDVDQLAAHRRPSLARCPSSAPPGSSCSDPSSSSRRRPSPTRQVEDAGRGRAPRIQVVPSASHLSEDSPRTPASKAIDPPHAAQQRHVVPLVGEKAGSAGMLPREPEAGPLPRDRPRVMT